MLNQKGFRKELFTRFRSGGYLTGCGNDARSCFLSALDATIVALALPSIAQHFQLSDSQVSAVTLGYTIPLTLLILPSGDLVSRFRVLPARSPTWQVG